MKVKLSIPICCPDGSFKSGDEPNLSEAIAKGLIEAGYAVSLEVTDEVTPKIEKKPPIKGGSK